MFVILRGAHARFERGGRPASADDTCCPSASAEILRGSCALFGRPSHVPRDCPTPQVQASSPGGGTCAGSLVESGSVGASPGAFRACLPARRSPSEHCFGALPEAGAARPSCRACRARIPAHRRAFACGRGKRLSRRCSGDVMGVAVLPRRAPRIFLRFRQDGGKSCGGERGGLLPGRENGRSAEDRVSRTPDNQAEASAFVRISPCAWRRAPVPWWR